MVQEDHAKFLLSLRNPKDMLVSYYHFYRIFVGEITFIGTWNEFFEMFRAKKLAYGDFFDWCKGWLKYRDSPKVLVVKYEDMKKDMLNEVQRVITFLGKDSVLTEKQIQDIVHHCTFKEMEKNDMVNYKYYENGFLDQSISPFMRKGVVGDWKNYFNDEQSTYVDELCRSLEKDGLTFEFS